MSHERYQAMNNPYAYNSTYQTKNAIALVFVWISGLVVSGMKLLYFHLSSCINNYIYHDNYNYLSNFIITQIWNFPSITPKYYQMSFWNCYDSTPPPPALFLVVKQKYDVYLAKMTRKIIPDKSCQKNSGEKFFSLHGGKYFFYIIHFRKLKILRNLFLYYFMKSIFDWQNSKLC